MCCQVIKVVSDVLRSIDLLSRLLENFLVHNDPTHPWHLIKEVSKFIRSAIDCFKNVKKNWKNKAKKASDISLDECILIDYKPLLFFIAVSFPSRRKIGTLL